MRTPPPKALAGSVALFLAMAQLLALRTAPGPLVTKEEIAPEEGARFEVKVLLTRRTVPVLRRAPPLPVEVLSAKVHSPTTERGCPD